MPTTEPPFDGAPSITVPDHELLRLIGKGSYGEVWLARNIMGSYRAVKIIRRSFFQDHSPFDREFAGIKKFEPISRTHSGFVDILQIGRNDEAGCLYYVMEAADDLHLGQSIEADTYVPRTLGKALAQVKRFPVDQCVQMGLALCQALETLHRHGLVHRDIKPSNIVFVNGVPKLADIGLVTESNNARSFVGTEGFIPPEGPGTERADIFSLGKALYEIASGRDRLDFPALPPDLSEFKDGEQFLELNECLIRACRLDHEKRYASAREMYEDLALLASGKSLRRLRILERRWENAKRTAALTAGVVALSAAIIWPVLRERQHADEIRERQIGVRSANGITKLDQGDLPGALREFSEIFRLQAGDQRHFAANQIRVASILANNPKLTEMAFLSGKVSSAELSEDGKQLLTVEKYDQARFFDLQTGADLVAPLKLPYVVQGSLSPRTDFAVLADAAGSAVLWNLKSGQTAQLEHPANVLCTRFSPSGRLMATACNDGKARIWDTATSQLLFEMTGHTNALRSVAFSSDERLLVSTATDFTARVWDAQTGRQVGPALRHPSWVTDAAFSPDSKLVVTACLDGWARAWKVGSGENLPTLIKHDDVVTRVAFSPDGTMILTASNDATVCLWDATTMMPMARNHVLRHSAGVMTAAFRGNGHQILTGCWDGTVRLWDLAGSEMQPELVNGVVNDTGTMSAEIQPNTIRVQSMSGGTRVIDRPVEGEVRALALSASGDALAACTVGAEPGSATVTVWRPIETDDPVKFRIKVADPVAAFQLSPDGSILAVQTVMINRTTTARIFDAASGDEWPIDDGLKKNAAIAFHPHRRAFAIGAGQNFEFYENQSPSASLKNVVEGDVHHLAFSADGHRLLISQSDDQISPKSAVIFDLEKRQLTDIQFWHRDGVLHGAFSPDGTRVITGGEDRELVIWNASSGEESLPPLHHRQQVSAVEFSPDGRWIGSVSADAVARIWDSQTGFPVTPPLGCARSQTEIIFLPDGTRFATVQSPTRTWLWTLPRTNLSPEDAVSVSHLLNADIRSVGPTDTKQISATWSELKRNFPDLFRANESQVKSWHGRQLQIAESKNLPLAAAFHRNHLEDAESSAMLPPRPTLAGAAAVAR